QRLLVADDDHWTRRTHAARGLGPRAVGLPRHHRARFPEPLLRVRAGHEPRARWFLDLPVRVSAALHPRRHPPRTRRRPRVDRGARRRGRRVPRPVPRRDQADGVVAPIRAALALQESRRRDLHAVALAHPHLLALDARGRSRALRIAGMTEPAPVEVRVATADDLPAVLGILDEAAAWLWSRGIRQWPEYFEPQWVLPRLEARETWLAWSGGEAAGSLPV